MTKHGSPRTRAAPTAPATTAAAAQTISPEILAVIASAVAVTVGPRARVAAGRVDLADDDLGAEGGGDRLGEKTHAAEQGLPRGFVEQQLLGCHSDSP